MSLGYSSRHGAFIDVRDSLVGLVNDIPTNVFTGLNRVSADMDVECRKRDHKSERLQIECGYGLAPWKPSPLDVDTLCLLADRAFAPEHELHRWYDLGSTVGRLVTQHDGHTEVPVKLANFLSKICSLPSASVDAIGLLRDLAAINLGAGRVEANARKVLRKHGLLRSSRSPLSPDIVNKFFWKIVNELRGLHADAERPASSPHDQRDRYLYEQRRKGVAHKDLIKYMAERPDWASLGSAGAINRAIDRFLERNDFPPRPRRNRGRPRRRN